MNKIVYGLVGIALFFSVIATGSYGLTEENIEIYQMAMEQQQELGNVGFPGFDVRDYPVSFYTGSADYVVTGKMESDGQYEIKKENR